MLTQLQEPPRSGHHVDILLPGPVQLGKGVPVFPSAINYVFLCVSCLFVDRGTGNLAAIHFTFPPWVVLRYRYWNSLALTSMTWGRSKLDPLL